VVQWHLLLINSVDSAKTTLSGTNEAFTGNGEKENKRPGRWRQGIESNGTRDKKSKKDFDPANRH